jgi:hypothetical protein
MAVSSFRSSLYRSAAPLVTLLAAALILVQAGSAQFAGKDKAPKSPRALALLQLSNDGKTRLFPIAILDNGKFFDAGAYKAKPVPMALEPQTVYEGVRAGVPQGLFTITGAGQLNGAWVAEGAWLPTGAEPPRKGKKAEMPVIKDNTDAPPTLKRPGPEPKATDTTAAKKNEDKPQPPPEMKPVIPPNPAETKPASHTASTTADPNRPTLRRGLPSQKPAAADEPATKATPLHTKSEKANAPQTLVAISDASGPELRPYNFGAKPDEIEKYLKLMLDLAAQDVRKRIDELSASTQPPASGKSATKKTPTAKGPRPKFSDIDFRVFDLSNANEPVWILTAKAQMPSTNAVPDAPAPAEYFVTLVCRTDIYGDLRKLLTQITDAKHLDVVSRLELVDAVDADGDSRGELLFREISANNTRGYVLYRFTGDTLWKLFDSFGGE